MSCSFQSSQFGSIASFKNYFISSSLTILRESTGPRHFSSSCGVQIFFIPNRPYSSSSSHALVPAVVYPNPDEDKEKVIKENKGKSGVYC